MKFNGKLKTKTTRKEFVKICKIPGLSLPFQGALSSCNKEDENNIKFSAPPDRKFVNSSWFNFFEEYIVPSISNKLYTDGEDWVSIHTAAQSAKSAIEEIVN